MPMPFASMSRAATGMRAAAETLRISPRCAGGDVHITGQRAELIAALLTDAARVFDELSIALEKDAEADISLQPPT